MTSLQLKFIRTHLSYLLMLTGIVAILLCIPQIIFAASDYQPLTAIPGVTQDHNSLADYINALFFLSSIVGALLAVVKIAFGGFQYMMSGIVTDKAQAKKDITSALLGLGILLASVTVLYTINTDLVNLDILRNARTNTIGLDGRTTNNTGGTTGGSTSLPKPEDASDVLLWKTTAIDRDKYGSDYGGRQRFKADYVGACLKGSWGNPRGVPALNGEDVYCYKKKEDVSG